MLWFLIIGAIAGWLAGQISSGRGFGLLGDMAVGIIGSFLGGFLFNLIGPNAYGTIGSIVVATVGAVAFLWLVRLVTGSNKQKQQR